MVLLSFYGSGRGRYGKGVVHCGMSVLFSGYAGGLAAVSLAQGGSSQVC